MSAAAPPSPSRERPRVATDTPRPMAFSGRSPTADALTRERPRVATDTPLSMAFSGRSPRDNQPERQQA